MYFIQLYTEYSCLSNCFDILCRLFMNIGNNSVHRVCFKRVVHNMEEHFGIIIIITTLFLFFVG